MLGATTCGKVFIPPVLQAHILARRLLPGAGAADWPAGYEAILIDIRLPRVVLGALVGGALAVAGASYQGLFRNPLADPYLMGVASGAGLGAVLAFVLPFPAVLYSLGLVQAAAFLGALITVGAVYLFARVGKTTPVASLILSGVAVGALINAWMAYLMYLHGDQVMLITAWLLGGFNRASWSQVALIAPGVLVSSLIVFACARALNVLQLGEEQAAALGLNVERVKLVVVGAATLATAAAVSTSGLIGFVGLIVPHTARMLCGPDHRRLAPVSALCGAAFLVAADALARALPGPGEVPVGIVTAAFGAPFFLFLLRRQKRALL